MNLKSLILILLLACSWSVFGQSPQKFKFQAVARDASNNPYTSANLAVRISLVRDGVSGQIDYSERHEVTTSPVGVFDLEIGGGTAITSSFPNVNWEMHSYYLKVDIDPNGGTNYLNLGTSQLLSVPYAIYAGKAGNGGGGGNPTDELQNLIYDPNTQTLTLTDGNTVTLSFPGGSDSQSLSFNSNTSELTISNGNTVTIPAGNGQVGPQGPAGPAGSTGPAGAAGTAGTQGVAGTQGPQGPAGAGVQIIGSVANAAALNPAYAGAIGDMFISQNDGHGHVWSGATWDDVGQIQGPAGAQGAAGAAGTTGSTGATGSQGPAGQQGATGAAGTQGATGAQGPAGTAGVQGQQGPAGTGVQIIGSVANAAALNPAYAGATGDMFISQNDGHGHVWNGATWDDVGQIQGPAGAQGIAGITGTTGAAGATGAQGPAGQQGATGAAGATGAQGAAGAVGAQGQQGAAGTGVQIIGSVANVAALNPAYAGATGDMFISQNDGHGHVWNGATWDDVGQIQGPAGAQGTTGAQGATGATGSVGATGAQGPAGQQGTTGATGAAGTDGTTGAQGPAGATGSVGAAGAQGATGPQGNVGAIGPAGATGSQGNTGATGAQGMTGTTGATGATGATGPAGTYTAGAGINIASGTISATGGSSVWTASGSDIYRTSGLVGIGTAIPTVPLHVNGGTIFNPSMILQGDFPWLAFNDASNTLKGQLAYVQNEKKLVLANNDSDGSISFNIDGTESMIIDYDGNVGIGDADPLHPLSVSGSIQSKGADAALYFEEADTYQGGIYPFLGNLIIDNAFDSDIVFETNSNTTRAIINNDGILVKGDLTLDEPGSEDPAIQFLNGNGWHGYLLSDGTDMIMGNTHNQSILFQTNATNKAEFNGEGLILDGKSSQKIELTAPTSPGPMLKATVSGNPTRLAIASNGVSISTTGTTNSGDYMLRIVEPGNYGLNIFNGATENDWELYADGAGNLQLWADTNFQGSFDGSTGAYNVGSDRRLKTNIQPLESTLMAVMALKPSRYQYIANNPDKEETIGFIAQEVQAIFPELVLVNKSDRLDSILSVNYSGFGIVAVKAIQEQQLIIEDLEKRLEGKSAELNNQQQQIDALEARLSRLEALLDK